MTSSGFCVRAFREPPLRECREYFCESQEECWLLAAGCWWRGNLRLPLVFPVCEGGIDCLSPFVKGGGGILVKRGYRLPRRPASPDILAMTLWGGFCRWVYSKPTCSGETTFSPSFRHPGRRFFTPASPCSSCF